MCILVTTSLPNNYKENDFWGEERICNFCAGGWNWMWARTRSPKWTMGDSWGLLKPFSYEVSAIGCDEVAVDLISCMLNKSRKKQAIYLVWMNSVMIRKSNSDGSDLATQSLVKISQCFPDFDKFTVWWTDLNRQWHFTTHLFWKSEKSRMAVTLNDRLCEAVDCNELLESLDCYMDWLKDLETMTCSWDIEVIVSTNVSTLRFSTSPWTS